MNQRPRALIAQYQMPTVNSKDLMDHLAAWVPDAY
jgi:hypothetical protein